MTYDSASNEVSRGSAHE